MCCCAGCGCLWRRTAPYSRTTTTDEDRAAEERGTRVTFTRARQVSQTVSDTLVLRVVVLWQWQLVDEGVGRWRLPMIRSRRIYRPSVRGQLC